MLIALPLPVYPFLSLFPGPWFSRPDAQLLLSCLAPSLFCTAMTAILRPLPLFFSDLPVEDPLALKRPPLFHNTNLSCTSFGGRLPTALPCRALFFVVFVRLFVLYVMLALSSARSSCYPALYSIVLAYQSPIVSPHALSLLFFLVFCSQLSRLYLTFGILSLLVGALPLSPLSVL